MVALPFCHVHLMAQKPQKWQLLDPPRTIGDHIRKRRLQLEWGIMQLALLLKVTTDTVYNWEHNRSGPSIRFMPALVQFLGYDPADSTVTTLGEKIKKYRIEHGLSQKRLAIQMGMDSLTVRRLEYNRGKPTRRILKQIIQILG
jgi:transcriptional regulator with XRE-family HTH domain